MSDIDSIVKNVLSRFEEYFKNASSIEILGLIMSLSKLQSRLCDLLIVRIMREAQQLRSQNKD